MHYGFYITLLVSDFFSDRFIGAVLFRAVVNDHESMTALVVLVDDAESFIRAEL